MRVVTLLTLLVVVLILYIILSPHSLVYHKNKLERRVEMFEEKPLTWRVYNRMAKRNLQFMPPHTKALASDRVEIETETKYDTQANCASKEYTLNVNNEAQSLVIENYVLYKLKSLCISLPVLDLPLASGVSIYIDNIATWYKYAYLKLLNPLFVEINKNGNQTSSVAMYIREEKPYTICNYGEGDYSLPRKERFSSMVLSYKPITDENLFNYPDTFTKTLDTFSLKNKDILQIRAFYIQQHATTQSIAKVVNFTKPQDRYLVSSANHESIEIIKKETNGSIKAFQLFSNMIDIYFNSTKRSIAPIFTIAYTLSLNVDESKISTDNLKTVVFEMYMKNELGTSSTCNSDIRYGREGAFGMNGNILTSAISFPNNSIENKTLTLSLGTSRGGCLFGNKNETMNVVLPYYTDRTTTANIYVTVSTTSIDFLAHWVTPYNDVNTSRNAQIQWVYSQLPLNEDNDFSKLFTGAKDVTKVTLGDIIINTNTNYVSQVKNVRLGYINMAAELYAATHWSLQ